MGCEKVNWKKLAQDRVQRRAFGIGGVAPSECAPRGFLELRHARHKSAAPKIVQYTPSWNRH